MENKQTLRQAIDEYSNVARFAKCLDISRPSMYKYIELFDNGDTSSIPENVLIVFKTLMGGNRDFRMIYCNELYSRYLKENERTEEPVPRDIAEKIDSQNITLTWVDDQIRFCELMIRNAEEELEEYRDDPRNREFYEERIREWEKELRDLEFTREMIEKRNGERHFQSPDMKKWKGTIELDWEASTGEGRYDLWPTCDDIFKMWCSGEIDYGEGVKNSDVIYIDERTLEKHPELKDAFKYTKIKNKDGYVFLFAGASQDDEIVVNIFTDGFYTSGVYTRIASFSPEKGQFYVKIPKIFDDEYEKCFMYSVERRNNGKLLNCIRDWFRLF